MALIAFTLSKNKNLVCSETHIRKSRILQPICVRLRTDAHGYGAYRISDNNTQKCFFVRLGDAGQSV